MNKSFLKFVTDFGPLAIFFFYYYNSDKNLSVAIPPLIVATLIALAVVWFFEKKIPMMPLISGILITFFGGLTIYFNDPVFIYVKPTIINILFALALYFGKYFTNEPVLKKIMGKSIAITNIGWELPKNEFVNITIYNSLGEVVKILVNSFQSSGYKTIKWDATDSRKKPLSSGLYIYRLQSDSHVDTKKMILLR